MVDYRLLCKIKDNQIDNGETEIDGDGRSLLEEVHKCHFFNYFEIYLVE